MSNFKRLCEITAESIDCEKLSNPTLRRLLKEVTPNSTYVFGGSRKGHKDHTESDGPSRHSDHSEYSVSSNWPPGQQIPEHSDCPAGHTEHTDHTDHNDHTESAHKDNHYNEASYHTDSDGGHKDYNERSHRDN